jgi:hypothetical protein
MRWIPAPPSVDKKLHQSGYGIEILTQIGKGSRGIVPYQIGQKGQKAADAFAFVFFISAR